VSDDWEQATIEDLQRQRADLDRLIAEAQRIRADITEHLDRLARGQLPTRAFLPPDGVQRRRVKRKPS
jgi:hypothetical protein